MLTFTRAMTLYRNARRPAIRILTGLSMMAAAGAVLAFTHDSKPRMTVTEQQLEVAAAQARDAVATAWRQGVLDRERVRVSAQYAARCRIPLDLADDIHWAAKKERIDPSLAFRLIRVESAFRTTAVSPKGAVGLTQVKPSTARWLFPGTSRDDLMEPRFNARVGFRYLRRLLDTYGDPHLALVAYNRGPARVDSLLSAGIDPGNGYAEAVLTGDRTKHTAFVAARRAAAEETKVRAAS